MREPRSRLTGGRVFLIILLLFAVVGYLGYVGISSSIKPVGSGANEKLVQVEQGSSTEQVFKQLEDENLITSTTISKVYMKLFGSETIYAGEYRLNDGMSLGEIIAYISNPDNGQLESTTITIGEGDWAKTIASKIETLYPDYKADDTIALWNNDNYIKELSDDYEFIKPELLQDKNLKVKLEGYLYPQTYFLAKSATLDEITRTFLSQFKKEVYAPLKEDFEASKYSVEEIVNLASIIQFEAGAIKDMPMIAKVFENRLNSNMKLESSATVCYGLYDDFDSINACESNPSFESPYNTYLHEGLPPGPILNPGKDAIQSVLEPATEFQNPGSPQPDKDADGYYFFAADIKGISAYPGAVYYTKTFEEHDAKCRELDLFNIQE